MILRIFQATCPLLTAETIKKCVDVFEEGDEFDWAITATEANHLFWREGAPLTDRLNRQELEGTLRETGAVQLMTSTYASTEEGRQGTLPCPEAEALDVDTHDDMMLAEARAARLRIHFVVASGHGVSVLSHPKGVIVHDKTVGHPLVPWT